MNDQLSKEIEPMKRKQTEIQKTKDLLKIRAAEVSKMRKSIKDGADVGDHILSYLKNS